MSRIKRLILHHVNAPQGGVRSSQTLYECLFYAVARYRVTRSDEWAQMATHVAESLCDIQLDDGGFDIGYEFLFAHGVRKRSVREATSPEVLAVAALAQYLDLEVDSRSRSRVILAVRRGVNWILRFAIDTGQGFAIPYAPYSLPEIHITNATSFAASALACSLCYVEEENRPRVEGVLRGMCLFMRGQLVESGDGCYWPYFHHVSAASEYEKIDNYHIAQQLFHHCLIGDHVVDENNSFIISKVSTYLLNMQSPDGFISYTVKGGKNSGYVSVWGFASVVSSFALASKVMGNAAFYDGAKLARKYLLDRCRVGWHFAAVVDHDSKTISDPRHYPRSDAWVIHGLAELGLDEDYVFCDYLFNRVVSSNFRGDENHTLTWRKRFFYAVVASARRVNQRFLGRSSV